MSVLLLFSTKSSFAQLYTWKDEQGTTHVTDDLTNAPPEIQQKHAIPVEVIELPKRIEQPRPNNLPPAVFFSEYKDKINGYTVITTSLEGVKKEPYKYKYKWTTNNGITFYTNRIIKDNDPAISILPNEHLPHGKFTQIVYK